MRNAAAFALALAALVTMTGCGGTSGTFDAGHGTAALTCMEHQRHTPPVNYTDDTARGLLLLRYYTTNGTRPYCDHRHATPADRAWARLYLKLGANPSPVSSILRPSR
ncbi:hypothetical protein [Actinomadura sp. DC4]|uniref:hypothetical protein n=1 Tax=Actinomadura sp. DC4 TaxID=3055069 RepID=UPI0025AFB3A5|nr:hypothetical protein [Actinomadura sp. DC4]MDN3358524.1 hypothetical protein [Actinomadura sp. DC4]